MNGTLSETSPLGRGTHQGCPLSPGLFAIALRAETGVKGIAVGAIEEKVSLYADDTLLYLVDASQSLRKALDLFKDFG